MKTKLVQAYLYSNKSFFIRNMSIRNMRLKLGISFISFDLSFFRYGYPSDTKISFKEDHVKKLVHKINNTKVHNKSKYLENKSKNEVKRKEKQSIQLQNIRQAQFLVSP